MKKDRFSKRFGYDPNNPREPILEDAPERTRIAYLNAILFKLTYVDNDSRYINPERRPLGIKALYEGFCVLTRTDIDEEIYDSWAASNVLEAEVRGVPWYHFYDFVEFVGARLLKRQPDSPFDDPDEEYSYDSYREKVNELFEEDSIGWRLDATGRLTRQRPAALDRRIGATEAALKDEFEPARVHYKKAVRYIYEHPLDPENAIKEMVSAVESAGRAQYSGTKTLGDVIKRMRAEGRLPAGLVAMIEKYYAFASAEPAVRHGSPDPSRLGLDEAELGVHIGIAIVRYMVARSKEAGAK